ncbi:MAG: hypothetical protein ACR2KP_06845 [Egibacteraceae bacterium]|jgi:hypothetical protein
MTADSASTTVTEIAAVARRLERPPTLMGLPSASTDPPLFAGQIGN